MEPTRADDLLLYDRGYPAFWLFALHQQEQRHFCARLSLSFSAEVERFLADGRKSEVVTFEPTAEARKHCAMYDLPIDPVRLRLIKVRLDSGEIEVLATSLLDEADFPAAWFKALPD
jgi:hypothetical protein